MAVTAHPIGPAKMLRYRVNAALEASAKPLPNKALLTAFATITAIL